MNDGAIASRGEISNFARRRNSQYKIDCVNFEAQEFYSNVKHEICLIKRLLARVIVVMCWILLRERISHHIDNRGW